MTEPIYRGMTNDDTFRTIVLKPDWKQYLVGQFGMVLICLLFLIFLSVIPQEQGWLWKSTGIALVAILSCFIYHVLDMARMQYVITEEQIIYHHGLVIHQVDYLELYRVVDYQQNRTAFQQLLGIKTLRLLSGDRNTPVLDIIGIPKEKELIPIIRERVEYNKTRRGIYEFTNR